MKTVSKKAIVDHIVGYAVSEDYSVRFYGYADHLQFLKDLGEEHAASIGEWTEDDDIVIITINKEYAPTHYYSAAYTIGMILSAANVPIEDAEIHISQVPPYSAPAYVDCKGYVTFTIELLGYKLEE